METKKSEKKMPVMAGSNPVGCVVDRQIDDRRSFEKKLIDARLNEAENLYRMDLYSHFGCVNAIEFSKKGDILISGKKLILFNSI